MQLLNNYVNGNACIKIFDDGTRIIDWPDYEQLNLDFPLSMDFKITNWCDENCPMCHEMSNINGEHGDIMNLEFVNHLHAGTEMAIGGGKVTSHPDLKPFLKKLNSIGVLPSITVHQNEYINNIDLIENLINEKLINGLGISYSHQNITMLKRAFKYPNTVIHLIAGIHGNNVFDFLSKFNCKILILGYKNWGRGKNYSLKNEPFIERNIDWLKENLSNYLDKFKVVSFDNLAIEQLDVRNLLNEDEWQEFYQGNDGTMTMYVDGVKKQFAKTSTSEDRFSLLPTAEEMFKIVRGLA